MVTRMLGAHGEAADTSWMNSGKCREYPPNTFFPSDSVGVSIARRICAVCPMKAICLEYALDNQIEHGIWGGTSERARRRMVRARLNMAQLDTAAS